MDTITMDPQEARDRARVYRKALHRSAEEEYRAVLAGLEAMGEGYPVINYSVAIRDAPVDDRGRPMLAVARANARQVAFRHQGGTSATFSTLPRSLGQNRGQHTWDYVARFPTGLMVRRVELARAPQVQTRWEAVDGFALVPLVPPEALTAIGGTSRLVSHLILWEVEEWADNVIGAKPDIDPLLLRPIHGDLCAVVAQWDLTELERSVMASRAVVL